MDITRLVRIKQSPTQWSLAYVFCASKGFEKYSLKNGTISLTQWSFSELLWHSFFLIFYWLPLGPITTYIEDILVSGDAFGIVEIRTKGKAYHVWVFQQKQDDFFCEDYEAFSFFKAYIVQSPFIMVKTHTLEYNCYRNVLSFE